LWEIGENVLESHNPRLSDNCRYIVFSVKLGHGVKITDTKSLIGTNQEIRDSIVVKTLSITWRYVHERKPT
jgi:hypothetical protein